MKFICESADLSNAISVVGKYVSTKTTNPILENIYIGANDNTITLSATDELLSIEKKINGEIIESGETTVNGKFLADYSKKMTDGSITFETDNKNALKIKYLDSVGKVQCLDSAEFPQIPQFQNYDFVEIKECDLKDIINKSIFASADDDIRPILKGCLFDIKSDTIKSVALDGFRIAVAKSQIVNKSNEMAVVVPNRTLYELYKLLSNTEDTIKLYINNNYINIIIGGYNITSRLIAGDFIAYENVIPKEFATNVTVNKEQLELALERTSILSKLSNNSLVKFEIEDNSLTISSKTEQGSIKENLVIARNGNDNLTISFNFKYILEALKTINDDFVTLRFIDSTKPCVINAVENGNYLFLILPVRTL